MQLKEKKFVANSMEENLMFINDMSFYDTISDDQFVDSIFSFDITTQDVTSIEKEYTLRNKNKMKILEDSVIKAYGKKVVDPRVTY